MERQRVYSGIRATGRLHLGNYMGAVKGMLALQETHDCIFSVVDMHAITTPYDPKTLSQSVRDVVLDYLAAGLDPEKCLLEVQSLVPEHTELAYLLATIFPVSRLEDLPTYKDKKAQHPKYVNMGLLFYPVLMAADIMLYKANLVPVGLDQEPHIEVTREIVRKFNSTYGETFPEPKRYHDRTPAGRQGEYVPSLTGEGKMSKSVEGSYISLSDDKEAIRKKIAKMPTDSGTLGGKIPQTGGVGNLFALAYLFGGADLHQKYVVDYKEKKIRYSEMKAEVVEAIYQELAPIHERRKAFEENPGIVDTIIAENAEKCRGLAQITMTEVKKKMGLIA